MRNCGSALAREVLDRARGVDLGAEAVEGARETGEGRFPRHYASEEGLASGLIPFGNEAEVVSPDGLGEALAARAEATLAHYRAARP